MIEQHGSENYQDNTAGGQEGVCTTVDTQQYKIACRLYRRSRHLMLLKEMSVEVIDQRPPPSSVAALIAAKEETAATVVLSEKTIVPPIQHSLVKIQILKFKLHVGF